MTRASRIGLLIVGTLLSADIVADDALSRYASRWQLSQPTETIIVSSDESQPIARFDFQNSDAFSRVKKLRELSLLTLAEVGKARLFIGVNDEGLVGLHFRAFPRPGDERSLEIVRMPYLEKNDTDSDVD